MSGVSVNEYLSKASQYEQWVGQELSEAVTRGERLTQSLKEVGAEFERATATLCQQLLPVLDEPSINALARRTGLRLWVGGDPLGDRERDRERLQRRIEALRNDGNYLRRDELLDPVVGSLTLELEQLEADRAPLVSLRDKFDHPRLDHLLAIGYGTPDYPIPFWRLAYYQDWKAADEILERFPDLHTGEASAFHEIRRRVREVRGALALVEERIHALEMKKQQVLKVIADLRRAELDLETIEERHLGLTHKRLAELVEQVPESALGPRLADAPELEALAKRWSGLRAKRVYLKDLVIELERYENDLRSRRAKVRRDIMKMRRPKNAGRRFDPQQVERRYGDRSAKSRKYWTRFDRGYESMSRFDGYDRARWATDFLWWDLMTDACPAPHVIAVREFHEKHPNYVWKGDDDSKAAAAIAGAPEREDAFSDYS